MIENILVCVCSECGDTYNIGNVYEDMANDYEKLKFVSNKQTCLRCGKQYLPFGNIYNMDDFVFDAVKRCKM